MGLKQVLLPLIIESRKRFGDSSLLLMLDSIKIGYQRMDHELSRKPLPESVDGLNNLELLEVSSGNNSVQGYIGEIRYWQTKSCQNLDEILVDMFRIDNLDILPSEILHDVSVWKKKDNRIVKHGEFVTVFCFNLSNDNEYIVSDSEMLTFLEYSLQLHFGTTLQIPVEEVEQIALPVAIFRQLWIAITEFKFIKISMKIYDFDGFECGYVRGISFNRSILECIKKFPEEPAGSEAYKKTQENSERNDNNLNEFHSHGKERIKQGIQSSTEIDISSPSYFHDHTRIHISESVTSAGNKLSILNKIRKAVEMIVEVPCDDDRVSFISLGFDSLKLAKLEFVLQTQFKGKFSIAYGSAHQHPTIDDLSEYILKSSIEGNSIPKNMKATNFQFLTEKLTKIIRSSTEIPLSAAQKRLIFFYQLDPEQKSNFIETVKFSIESLKIHRLQKAFNRVVARHTALRSIYTVTGQTILSLTEAYFWIRVESRNVFESLKSTDLFDPTVPMRLFIAEQEDTRASRKLKEGISDRGNHWAPRKAQTACTHVVDIRSLNLIVIQMHHIMIDGFSIKLLTDELRMLYYGKNPLKLVPYQYGHFVLLEHQQRQDSESQKLREDFWQHQLFNVALQALPVDEIGLQVGRYSGRCLQFKIDSKIQKCLKNLATCCCVTQFSVLLANFQLLQYKRHGFKDCCVGIAVAQREIPELCTIIGCLLNVVPLINTINPSDRIHDFITKSNKRLNECIQKQLQFDDLIATLCLERDLSNSPLFQVLFILDDSSDIHSAIQNNDINDGNDSNFAQYDQVWYFYFYKEGMRVKIEYNGSRFYQSTIETMVHQYLRLLHKMSQNLHILVEGIKMISSMEEFVDYKLRFQNRCDFPQKGTVLDLIDQQNRMNPYCNTVIQRGVPFSSAFLQRKSNQLSRFLTQSWLQFLGEEIQNDSFMLLIFDRSVFLLLTIFALWKCGIGVAPLNLEISSDQLKEILVKLICPAVIHERNRKQHQVVNQCFFEDISKNSCGTLFRNPEQQSPVFKHDINEVITLISGYSDQELRKKSTQRNLAYMTFTSGSTGTPKGVCTEFYGLNNLALNYTELLSIKSNSTIYQVVNPSFDIFFADILEAQTNGASLYLASQRIPDLEEMSKITHVYIMPAYLSAIQSEQFKKLTSLEQINFGGDYIQYKALQDALQIGLRFHNQYGMTEHSIYSTCKLMKVCDKTPSVGKPFKNIHFSIYDGDKNLCGQRIIGICCISGAGISRGYHNNEYLNQISFRSNRDLTQLELLSNCDRRYFYSGDRAEIKNAVGKLIFHGRSDFQVKIRGIQVDIPKIEAILGQHLLVKECIVCLQRIETEEFLIAYIISCEDIIPEMEERQIMIKSLNEYMMIKLQTFMIPSHYVFVQQFPLNIKGKIERTLLPIPEKPLKSKIPLKADYIFGPQEKQVMGIFTTLLPGKDIRLDDSFFEVGGDSLKALIAIQNIKRETGIDLPLRDIFQLTSFRAILESLKENCSTGNHEEVGNLTKLESARFKFNSLQIHNNICSKMSRKSEKICNESKQKSRFWFNGSVPVSLQQERLLFLYSFGKEFRESYKLQFLFTFHGYMNLKILNAALNYVMRKHRLLRTIFLHKAGKTIQEVVSLSECYIEVHRNTLGYDGIGSRIESELPDLYDTLLLAIAVSGNLELMLILDHLIVDGRSIAILSNDLVEFYNVLINRGNVSFDITEDSSYAEFSLKQRSELEKFRIALRSADYHLSINKAMVKDELQVQEECRYLKEMSLKLQNFLPLSLQFDLSNEGFDRGNNLIKLKMPLDLSTVKHFCMAERCTLFAYLLAVFSLTVRSSLADQQQLRDRFAVVTSALNREISTMNCVGLFVNTVIIPIDTSFQSVSELIRNLQQNIAQALQFQHIPFDYIIRKLNPRRDSAGTEAYQISFVVQSASAIKIPKIEGVETIIEEIGTKYAKFDQAWYCTEFEDCIEMSVEYRTEKYSNLKIKHAMELFVQIASQILSSRSAEVKDILESSKLINVNKLMVEMIKDDNSKDMSEVQDTIKKNWMLEEALLSIWKEVLGSPEISTFDNFFARGGHSLLIPSICYKIEQQINYQCPPQAIFKYQTIEELAKYIDNKQNSKALMASKERFKIRVCPLQESLVGMYYNAVTETAVSTSFITTTTTTRSTTAPLTTDLIKAYQTGFSISLKSINLSKLRRSLNLIIMGHSAFRATFYCQNNDFFQEIHSGTEIYITPRTTSEQAAMIVPNPFHAVPILCWLIHNIKQELSDDSHFELHFEISHVICDGKSLSIIARELYDNYFKDIQISMKNDDFIQFSKRTEQRFRERCTEMQGFWSQTLKDVESANLHYEKIIATVSCSNRCKFLHKRFKSLNSLIIRVAEKCCCSPFVVQVAAFSKVLSGIVTQASKIAISCPVDMRDSGAQQCVGMCINVLPVIIDLRLGKYQDLIQDIARSLADAYVNADISTKEMKKLCGEHGVSNFADIMVVNNYEEYSDHYHEILNDNSEFTKCVLTLFLTQYHKDIVAKIECKQDLFYNESMSIMLNQWARIIRKMEKIIVTENEMKYEDRRKCPYGIPSDGEYFSAENSMDMKSKEKVVSSEREECFMRRNDDKKVLRKCDYPAFSYQNLIREALVTNGRLTTITAVIGSKESINYRTLIRLIYRTSKIIREKIIRITGNTLRADTVIPIIAHNSIKTLVTCLAIIMAGAAYLPIDSTSPTKRVLNILEQMEAKFYVAIDKITNNDDEFQASLNFSFQNALEINLNDLGFDEEPLESQIYLRNTPNDLAYVIFTSGTTGKPKGVAVGQQGLLNMAIACTGDFWMGPGDCVYQFTNFAFDNSVLEIMMALINGSTLFLREDFFTPSKFLDEVKHGKITHALLFPGLVSTFTDEEIGELKHLRYWIVGAESASRRVLECALKSGVNVIQNYGPTETTAYALTKRMKLLDRPNNIGRGIMNVVTTIRNFCGEVLPEMGVGELCITGIGITRGYIVSADVKRDAEKENENKGISEINACRQISSRISFDTKDMVRLQPNNDILFLGRYDNQVKIRGYRVELSEIEAILCQYPQIKSAKVIPKLIGKQQQLVAFVILSDLLKTKFDPGIVRQFMLEQLPYYMVPTQYHSLQQYPLTKNSKIDVLALEMLQNPENDQYFKHIEPESTIEWKVLGFFRKVLQDDNISINDDFFAVGGNSFSAAQLTTLIEANLVHSIGINNVFRHRTVRRLSQYILNSHKKPSNERIHGIQGFHQINKKVFSLDNIPLSFQQQQFQFLNETKQRQYYELIFVQKFDASFSLRYLKLAFLRLILQQPSLRTIFPELNYDVHQELLSGTETYFYSNILQHSYYLTQPAFYNEDHVVETIKILRDEKINLKHEPPILCALETTSSASHTVILRMNHIISDAWSTNLLENDLRDLYQEVLKNKQFDSNSRLLFTYAEYSIEQFEQKHFLETLAAKYADKIVKWIINDPNFNNILENWGRIEDRMNQFDQINQYLEPGIFRKAVEYSKSTDFRNYLETGFTFEVRKIEKICGSLEITPFVAFLSAFASSLHELSGTSQLIINVPVANRSFKTNNIIGNFLNYLLINSTHIPLKEVDIISSASSDIMDNSRNKTKFAISKEQMARTPPTNIYARFMKKYVENINRTVNEIRQFEQVPFIALLKLIRIKLKKLKSPGTEVLYRLHKTVFFNFRYGLEENLESVIGKGEVQAPTDCIHEIEVEVDRVKSYYSCRIRMENRGHISALCQRMIFALQQMSVNANIQEITKDEKIKPRENAHEAIAKPSSLFFANDQGGNVIDLELRGIWSKCLKKRWIRDDDDFFLEGGTSLLTLKLRRFIESEFKIHIEIDEIFKYSTFTQLRSLLQKRLIDRDHSLPGKRIGFMNSESEKNSDLILQSAGNVSRKCSIVERADNLQTPENRTTVRLFHQNESNINITGSGVIVFSTHSIIGVEHPDSFSGRYSADHKFYQSIESLCSKYVRDLHDHLCNVKMRIFIGASFGAILAYQCAVQLQREEIHIDDIISIDGTAHWRRSTSATELSSYEEHRQQINKIVKYQTGDIKIDTELLGAMIENAWELLKMMRIYIPSQNSGSPSRLHVTLLKSPQKTTEDERDYGWMDLCSTTVVNIPFSHDTMLHNCNLDAIVEIILQTVEKLNRSTNNL
ncbi:AMP-binding enzyme family protein [Loa loa]|uniref:oleoyl-[acyl-carrier-protein] hydrolase n=1 Tax=Loa loa TaxID=7209 RepID=A0A1S0U8B1_LOALO|nr:AMP-binding enzyme family protein [Loa loa]EFO26749.2 AMP-binding enzyme family protein [Loa loa]